MTDERQAGLRAALDDVLRQRDDDTSVRRYAAAATAFLARYGDDLRAALAVAQVPAQEERLDVERLADAITIATRGTRVHVLIDESRPIAKLVAEQYRASATPSAQDEETP